MPDGKADRHILPSNSYRSGLRAGRAMERERAAQTFRRFIESENIASGEDAEAMARRFMEMLRGEEPKLSKL